MLTLHSAPRCALLCLLSFASYIPGAIAQETQPPTPPTPDTVLPETVVEAPPAVEDMPVDQEFDFDGILDGTIFDSPAVEGYRAESSTTGTWLDIPDADLPLTVNPITRDVLDDQIALRVTDIYRNAGGVNLLGDSQFYDRLLLRGQQVSSGNYRKDGFLDRTSVPRDFQNVERIEILKGPASVLYGAGDAAGLINLITKKPVNDRFANFGFTFGSYGQERFTLDANGIQSDNVFYRVNIAQEDSNSFVDFDYLSRTQIAPVVTWMMDDWTSRPWNGERPRDSRLGFQGTPALGGNALALPPSRNVGEPANDFFDSEEFRQSLVLNRQINDCWFYSIGGYSVFDSAPQSTTSATSFAPAIPDPPQPFFNRLRSDSPIQNEQNHSMIANLGGEFDTGALSHKALVGMEYAYLDSNSIFNASLPLPIPGPFDVTNPAYFNPPAFFAFGLQTNAFRQQRVGAYVQDLVQINPYWQALGGVRFDTVDFQFDRAVTIFPGPPTDLENIQTFNRASPRGGLVYQPFADESLAFYYSYSQSFSPPGGGAYFTFGPLNPVLGESHEAGIKTELVSGLSLTACGFHTERQNDTFVLTPSLITQVGEVRSQGAEVNLLGTITDRWNVLANYCYCDARVNDAALGLAGTPARNVPFNTGNIWTRYNFYQDCCQTYGAALGWVYVGDRASALFPNGIDLPSYNRWDAGIYYQRGQWNATAYLENLFDEQYAQSSTNQFQIFQGAPFNARATISYLY